MSKRKVEVKKDLTSKFEFSDDFFKFMATVETCFAAANAHAYALYNTDQLPASIENARLETVVHMVNLVLYHGSTDKPEHPSVLHNKNTMDRLAEGWSYGENPDTANKVSPLMTSFDKCPPIYQDESVIIASLAHHLLKDVNLDTVSKEFEIYYENILGNLKVNKDDGDSISEPDVDKS